jgi:prevent-host-death family protein
MPEIGAFEAKNRLGALLDRVERGEEIVITRRGKPVAKLVPAVARFDRTSARRPARSKPRCHSRRSEDQGPDQPGALVSFVLDNSVAQPRPHRQEPHGRRVPRVVNIVLRGVVALPLGQGAA